MRKMFSKNQIEEMIGQGVQESKEVISKITSDYNEPNTTFHFPKGVMPLSFYSGDGEILYIRPYDSIVNDNGELVWNIDDMFIERGRFHLTLIDENDNEITIEQLCENGLSYILFDGSDCGVFDTYAMFKPLRLYKHFITINTDESETYTFEVINWDNTHFDDIIDLGPATNCIIIGAELSNQAWTELPSAIHAEVMDQLVVTGSSTFRSTGDITSISDDITPL